MEFGGKSGVPRGRDGELTQDVPGAARLPADREPVTRRLDDGQSAAVPRVPTEVVPGLPAEPAPSDRSVRAAGSQPGPAVEQAWRSGRLPAPPRRARRTRLPGTLLTVALVAAAGLLAWTRFHHGPLRVTGAVISGQVRSGCGVLVTGRIATNGWPGIVSYRWVFTPGSPPGQRLEQSVTAGQHAVRVTVNVTGSGPGSPAQHVTLQVLDPGHAAASAIVRLRC